jgi:hypothetical protein
MGDILGSPCWDLLPGVVAGSSHGELLQVVVVGSYCGKSLWVLTRGGESLRICHRESFWGNHQGESLWGVVWEIVTRSCCGESLRGVLGRVVSCGEFSRGVVVGSF